MNARDPPFRPRLESRSPGEGRSLRNSTPVLRPERGGERVRGQRGRQARDLRGQRLTAAPPALAGASCMRSSPRPAGGTPPPAPGRRPDTACGSVGTERSARPHSQARGTGGPHAWTGPHIHRIGALRSCAHVVPDTRRTQVVEGNRCARCVSGVNPRKAIGSARAGGRSERSSRRKSGAGRLAPAEKPVDLLRW